MGVNRLNSVQKATNLKKKSKVGINEMLLLRRLQTSDHRFRAISALISTASPSDSLVLPNSECKGTA